MRGRKVKHHYWRQSQQQEFNHAGFFWACMAIVVVLGLVSTVADWLSP